MTYVDFSAGNKDYKLRLSVRAIIALEKQLGMNPIAVFGNGDTMPTITTMVQVLHASMTQLNHGVTLNDAYDIFDSWLADGHTMTDFLPIMIEIYRASGLIRNEEAAEGKN